MHDCNDPQRLSIGRIGYQVIPRIREAQRPRGEIWAAVALMRKRHNRLEGRLNLIDRSIGGILAALGYEFPNSIEIY
jgi:hypothetical protein